MYCVAFPFVAIIIILLLDYGASVQESPSLVVASKYRYVSLLESYRYPSKTQNGASYTNFSVLHPALLNFSIESPHVWLYKRGVPDRRAIGRVLIISIGGVGSSAIMMELRTPLRKLRYETNDLNNRDGLKHTTYSPLSRGAVAAFDPSLIIYVLGHPAAAVASHFRRGWPGVQFCLVNPDADAILAAEPRLHALLQIRQSKVNLVHNFTRIVSESKVDYFSTYSHALSWLGVTELGYTIVFTTLSTLNKLNRDGSLAGLLNRTVQAEQPLFNFTVRIDVFVLLVHVDVA